jgi:hypothetical protein
MWGCVCEDISGDVYSVYMYVLVYVLVYMSDVQVICE